MLFRISFYSFLIVILTFKACNGFRYSLPFRSKQIDFFDYGYGRTAQWYTQRLDHFKNADQRTWQQRYYVNEEFHITDGPVFIRVEGESEANPSWANSGQWIEWAEEFNALCFLLEHRYYGQSRPTEDTSVENLQYLNSEQALADLASFRTDMADLYKLPNSTKWIFFGGSYAGALVAWFRVKYPHLADGAVASSATVLAQVDAKEYMGVINDVINDTNPTCLDAIRTAFKQIDDLLAEGQSGWNTITDKFRLCDLLDGYNSNEVAYFYDLLSSHIAYFVQYDTEYKLTKSIHQLPRQISDLNNICFQMTADDELEIDRLAYIVGKYDDCFDVSYGKMILNLKPIEWDDDIVQDGSRQYLYQSCTEIGSYPTSDLPNQPFGDKFPVSYFVNQCKDVFGPSFDMNLFVAAIDRTNTLYGGRDIDVTKVIFPVGTKDPWKSECVLGDVNNEARAVFIEGGSHGSDTANSDFSDSVALVEARATIHDEIKKWISN